MEEKNLSIYRRIGRGFLALLPTVVFLAVQVVFISIVSGLAMGVLMVAGTGMDAQALTEQATELLMDAVMNIQVISQVLTLLVTLPWYYFLFVYRKGRIQLSQVFRPKKLAGMVILSLGFYVAVNFYMVFMGWALPGLMAEYEALVNESGIAGLTLLSTVATLVLAPIGEEIAYRGLTYRYLERTGMPFLAANLLQAALFGLVHMNWVQGGYAFALGFLLGIVYKKSGSLAAPMLMHMFFNFCGTYLATALTGVPLAVNILLLVLGPVCIGVGLRMTCLGPQWGERQEW